MNINDKAIYREPVVGAMTPQVVQATTKYTGVFAAKDFHQYRFIAAIGTQAGEEVADLRIWECDSAGNNTTEVKALTKACSATSATILDMNLRNEELVDYTRGYLKAGLVLSTTGASASVVAIGVDSRYAPAADIAEVTQKA